MEVAIDNFFFSQAVTYCADMKVVFQQLSTSKGKYAKCMFHKH